jgi:O-antigen/teichoic acid export membrane protein
LLLNLVLIPWLGIQGAALGTALALALSIPYLSAIMRWQLGFDYLVKAAPTRDEARGWSRPEGEQ